MISYEYFELDNGLRVFVHEDHTTPMAAFNICYNVGSRDENPDKTGFAHLFEHLMFGGSLHIPSYDEPLQQVGAENNAFTSPDITNYYITVPAVNIETAFWLESDRMLSLSFDPKVLEVQQKVVIEEFKQRYLNQPYGDVWLRLRPLAYQKHPYKWATIGKDISHIENATMDDVKSFFFTHYAPNNAILVVAGDVQISQVKELTQKWFGDIPRREVPVRDLPKEEKQTSARYETVEAAVPMDAIYKAYHCPGRYEKGYHEVDVLSDMLGRGKSSRLYQKLVKEKGIFTNIGSYCTGSLDPGLLVISGNIHEGFTLEEADAAIEEVVENVKKEGFEAFEIEKMKMQAETAIVYSEIDLLNRAMNLAFAANAGNPDWCNQELEKIQAIELSGVLKAAQEVLRKENCSTLLYKSVVKEQLSEIEE